MDLGRAMVVEKDAAKTERIMQELKQSVRMQDYWDVERQLKRQLRQDAEDTDDIESSLGEDLFIFTAASHLAAVNFDMGGEWAKEFCCFHPDRLKQMMFDLLLREVMDAGFYGKKHSRVKAVRQYIVFKHYGRRVSIAKRDMLEFSGNISDLDYIDDYDFGQVERGLNRMEKLFVSVYIQDWED